MQGKQVPKMLTLAVALAVGQCCEKLNVDYKTPEGNVNYNLTRVGLQDFDEGDREEITTYLAAGASENFLYKTIDSSGIFDVSKPTFASPFYFTHFYSIFKEDVYNSAFEKMVSYGATFIIYRGMFTRDTKECPEDSGNWHFVWNTTEGADFELLDPPIPIGEVNASLTLTCLDEEDDSGLSAGAIAGIAVGGSVGLAAVVYGLYYWLFRGQVVGIDGSSLL